MNLGKLLPIIFTVTLSCKENLPDNQLETNNDESINEPLRDERIEGEWKTTFAVENINIGKNTMTFDDGQGNDYPTGKYTLSEVNENGGKGHVFHKDWDKEYGEYFQYEIIPNGVKFDFSRGAVGIKCFRK